MNDYTQLSMATEMPLSQFFLGFTVIGLITYILYTSWIRQRYPPGPWPLPFIGNLHLLSRNLHRDLERLSMKYGPVYTVWMGARPTVVITDVNLAKEAYYKKGLDFAGRGMNTAGFYEIFHGDANMVTRDYDDKLVTLRKIGLSVMKTKATGGISIEKIVQEEMRYMIDAIKETAGQQVFPKRLVTLPVSNTVIRLLLNFRFKSMTDPKYCEFDTILDALLVGFRKALWISFAPIIWYLFPSVGRSIRKATENYDEFIDRFVKAHEQSYEVGVYRDLTDVILEKKMEIEMDVTPAFQLTRINVFEFVKSMVGGGTETVMQTMLWSFLILLHHPEIEERIHCELDNHMRTKMQIVVADSEESLTVTLADRAHLPYLNAFIHESMRRCTAVPLSLPRKTMTDTVLGSLKIPGGTSITFSTYSYHMDEKVWNKPSEFLPERFLDAKGNIDRAKQKLLFPFGAGPRACVGENLAKVEIFTYLSNILYNFKLSSNDCLPTIDEGELALAFHPKPFRVSFMSRE